MGAKTFAGERVAIISASTAGLLAARILHESYGDIPWQVSVRADLALEQVRGPRPFPVKRINAYVGRVQRVADQDPTVAGAFMKVMHMSEPPPACSRLQSRGVCSGVFVPKLPWLQPRLGLSPTE